MNRIANAFKNKKAFITFITGGDPDIATTKELILAMAEAGADMVEIGIPFSDPIAEGPVIQGADERALKAGCTVDMLFEMVKELRPQLDIPLLFLTYVNPIFAYGAGGVEKFMDRCVECGIDGLIVPDLPFEERGEIADICEKKGIKQIFLIAPTSRERIADIAREADGFLYCVSSLGVTGMRSEITTDVGEMIRQVKKVSNVPCAIGFGISGPRQAKEMAAVSDGVIIGSAIVKLVEEYGTESVQPVSEFVRRVKEAICGVQGF